MGLPEDVIVELLSRLPVKSLLRFRCVSKQWLNLISSSSSTSSPVGSLKHLHDHRNHRNHFSIFWNTSRRRPPPDSDYYRIWDYPYPDPDIYTVKIYVVDMVADTVHHEYDFDISGPVWTSAIYCRDLVCFMSSSRVYVCNPNTKELVEVPNCRVNGYQRFALGYLPSTKQYKLVHWFSLHVDGHLNWGEDCDDDCEMGCEIFTITDGGRVDSGSWRVTRNLPCMLLLQHGVCVNGVICWLVCHYDPKNYDHKLILCFDLDKEEYEMVSCPEPCASRECDIGYLLELKGLLCLVQHVFVSKSMLVKTWFLKKNQNDHDWVAGYNINLSSAFADIKLLAYNRANDDNEELVFVSRRGGVLNYNIRTQSFRTPKKLQHVTQERRQWGVHCFDSFFSLGSV